MFESDYLEVHVASYPVLEGLHHGVFVGSEQVGAFQDENELFVFQETDRRTEWNISEVGNDIPEDHLVDVLEFEADFEVHLVKQVVLRKP
eukprot:CAMPEP_0170490756 /NCGR_PEP_ID=MMETSP0208-20121228/8835_1 /TAXON_ID=197538 /ORGANISM="Strombidium inclinatum, Strain S3" /LENGTH=89 /DNA_ID=CAMNT_0010766197 /DNA_START=1775 /DNA_END=2044 /DNA_ORIENTATION=+